MKIVDSTQYAALSHEDRESACNLLPTDDDNKPTLKNIPAEKKEQAMCLENGVAVAFATKKHAKLPM